MALKIQLFAVAAAMLATLALTPQAAIAQDQSPGRVQAQGAEEGSGPRVPPRTSNVFPGGATESARPALRCFQRGEKIIDEEIDGGQFSLGDRLGEVRLKNGAAFILFAAGDGGVCSITAHRGGSLGK